MLNFDLILFNRLKRKATNADKLACKKRKSDSEKVGRQVLFVGEVK